MATLDRDDEHEPEEVRFSMPVPTLPPHLEMPLEVQFSIAQVVEGAKGLSHSEAISMLQACYSTHAPYVYALRSLLKEANQHLAKCSHVNAQLMAEVSELKEELDRIPSALRYQK